MSAEKNQPRTSQVKPWAPSALIESAPDGGIPIGGTAYLRTRVVGYVRDPDGTLVAIVESIDRNGEIPSGPATRAAYYVPADELIRGGVMKSEMESK